MIFKEFKFHDEALILSRLQINAVSEGWFVILVNVGKANGQNHFRSHEKCTPFNTHIDSIKESNQQNSPDTRRSLLQPSALTY